MFIKTGINNCSQDSDARFKAVPNPRLGEKIFRRGGIGLNLFAQLADENAQVFWLFDAIRAPDGR